MFQLNRLFVLAATIAFSVVCSAQSLVKVVENVEAIFYIKNDSIRRNGTTVEFWQITDFKQPRPNKKGELYQSMDQRYVVDCSNATLTLAHIKVYSSNMGTGNLIASGSMSQKNQIVSGSSSEVIRNFVCN
jgi:hypothetical protein